MNDIKLKEITLTLLPSQATDKNFILKKLKQHQKFLGFEIKSYRILRKSIDARKTPVKINMLVSVSDKETYPIEKNIRNYKPLPSNAPQIIIVGAGPAGLFAALRAIEKGLKPILVERGKDVETRRKDIADISRNGIINSNSNYCFGEGGAGAFSDGKLFTRSKKRGNIKAILEILHQFGASEEILIQSHPHIGSDKLPGVIKSIREKIKECGGEVRFNTKMTELILENKIVKGIITSTGDYIYGPVFLATGHSARDTIKVLHNQGIKIEPKGIAIGVRIEHPQKLIDKIQYHSEEGRGRYLPPAEYSFVHQADGRGVYSFCMCPGGVIVPAVSQEGEIVVNGMSASARSGKWANSGYVVELHPGDIKGFEKEGVFEMMALQEDLEKKFYNESDRDLNAPAQLIPDFIDDKISETLPPTSYAPGIHPADFNKLFPAEIAIRLKKGFNQIKEKCKEFISNEGVMIGLESRTSCPIRIPRNSETLCHVEIENLYPIGEGAGYAGGIVSSALDGMNAIDAYKNKIDSNGNNS